MAIYPLEKPEKQCQISKPMDKKVNPACLFLGKKENLARIFLEKRKIQLVH